MRLTAALILILLASAAPAFAEAGGHHDHHGFWSLRWFFVNFTLYIALLYFLLRKPLAKGWAARRAQIEGDIKAGAAKLSSANELFKSAEQRVARVEQDAAALTAQIESETQHESEELVSEAKRRAELIAVRAVESISTERRSAEAALRREHAERALEKAEEILRGELNPDADRNNRAAIMSNVGTLVQ